MIKIITAKENYSKQYNQTKQNTLQNHQDIIYRTHLKRLLTRNTKVSNQKKVNLQYRILEVDLNFIGNHKKS